MHDEFYELILGYSKNSASSMYVVKFHFQVFLNCVFLSELFNYIVFLYIVFYYIAFN